MLSKQRSLLTLNVHFFPDICNLNTAASEKKVGETPVFGRKLYYLDDCVNVWSDYLRIHLHPKTVCIVEQYTHDKLVCINSVLYY